MRKGVSPVVAMVLLIAIAVIAAIGVWYWVGAFVGKPPTGGQQKIALSIEGCNGSHLQIRNTGGLALTSNAIVFNSLGQQAAVINFSSFNLAVKNVSFIPLNAGTFSYSGTFTITDPSYPSYEFVC